jgi:hypothetical protein
MFGSGSVVACRFIGSAATGLAVAVAASSAAVAGRAHDEQRALMATYSGAFGAGADFRTLLVHPELVKGVLPFANYILVGIDAHATDIASC